MALGMNYKASNGNMNDFEGTSSYFIPQDTVVKKQASGMRIDTAETSHNYSSDASYASE